ncbi:MATA-HMG [Gigaspora margarita]|uniref:MATA-HMG n=1 Tax=Gigaspora margarita TaxID=4874 RepID=A0A8H4AHR1_GIGMA|nr:MATA-HMG [Gigaspora margarita]
MENRASETAKSRDIHFVNIITSNVPGVGSYCANGYSLKDEYDIDDEQLHTVPYMLSINIDDLTYPSRTSRRSKKTNKPPRPQNSFLLFRRDFEAKYRLLHKNEKIYSKTISTLAAASWNQQPPFVRYFFKKLECYALNKHQLMYPQYRYRPNKKKGNVIGERCLNNVPQASTMLDDPTANEVFYDSNAFIQADGLNYYFNNAFIHGNDFFYNSFNEFNCYLNDDTFLACNPEFIDPALYNTVLFEINGITYYVSGYQFQ